MNQAWGIFIALYYLPEPNNSCSDLLSPLLLPEFGDCKVELSGGASGLERLKPAEDNGSYLNRSLLSDSQGWMNSVHITNS